jgi:hypothetical protein
MPSVIHEFDEASAWLQLTMDVLFLWTSFCVAFLFLFFSTMAACADAGGKRPASVVEHSPLRQRLQALASSPLESSSAVRAPELHCMLHVVLLFMHVHE